MLASPLGRPLRLSRGRGDGTWLVTLLFFGTPLILTALFMYKESLLLQFTNGVGYCEVRSYVTYLPTGWSGCGACTPNLGLHFRLLYEYSLQKT